MYTNDIRATLKVALKQQKGAIFVNFHLYDHPRIKLNLSGFVEGQAEVAMAHNENYRVIFPSKFGQ